MVKDKALTMSSNNGLPNISAIVSDTSNFSMERYIRQGELHSCTSDKNYHGQPHQCACVLAGGKDYSACLKGYKAVQDKFQQLDTDPFQPLAWCVNNMEKESQSTNKDTQQGWLIGCINGIRK